MAPIAKRRKLDKGEEVTFDPAARQEYLTGFHKRKQQRIHNAREQAQKRDKEERVRERRQMREQRKEDLATHVAEANAELRKLNPDISDADGDEEADAGDIREWNGIEEEALRAERDEEYVDEEKHTTVTVEAMDLSNGMVGDGEDERKKVPLDKMSAPPGRRKHDRGREATKKKKKFRYESKAERQVTRQKQKVKNKAAKARREGG